MAPTFKVAPTFSLADMMQTPKGEVEMGPPFFLAPTFSLAD